jgi:ribosomal protein S4E
VPDTTSGYVMLPTAIFDVDKFVNLIWDEDMTSHNTANTSGSMLVQSTADSILSVPIDGTLTFEEGLKVFLSFVAGKTSGGGTTTITFRDIPDTKDRIVMVVDGNGNRYTTTLNLT